MFKRFTIAMFVMLLVIGTGLPVYGQAATATPSTPDVTATSTPAPTAQPITCFVSTDTARSATVRVGPGTNRTAMLFLSVEKSYSVVGVNTLADETVWFKLIKDEVDPGSGAAELWVAAEDVEQEGDCENIGTTVAPPIIPIRQEVAADAEVTQTLNDGTWRATYDSTYSFSCREDNSGEGSTAELFSPLVQDVAVDFADNGQSFSLTGQFSLFSFDTANPLEFILYGDNFFVAGIFSGDDVFAYSVTLRTPDRMTGELLITLVEGADICSVGINVELRRG